MQEEVENKSVAISIKATKLTANVLKAALLKALAEMEKKQKNPKVYKGKQSVKHLVRQGAGVSNIEITDGNIKSFEKVARKYGIDFALKKDASTQPPRYLVFFKSKDADALTAAFREYSGKVVKSQSKEKPSIRKQLSKTENKNRLEKKKPSKAYKASDFHLGDSVKVLSMNLTGTVNSLPDAKGNLFVQMGILRSQVNISDLELIEEPLTVTAKQMRRTSSGKMKMGKSMHVSPEINLLGKTVDEAVAELDKYLDDAYIAHLSPVRIVHGKGTGALRNGIHQYLRRQKHIKSFRLGAFGEGDAGVTIVEFK